MIDNPVNRQNGEKADRLKKAVLSLGEGGRALIAEVCGVTRQAVSSWERSGNVGQENLAIIARVTGFSINWLITGDGEPTDQTVDIAQGKDPMRLHLDEIMQACDLAMKHSGKHFNDKERLAIYLEGIEFAGRKLLPVDLVKHYLEEVIKKNNLQSSTDSFC